MVIMIFANFYPVIVVSLQCYNNYKLTALVGMLKLKAHMTHTESGMTFSCEGHTQLLHACIAVDESRSTTISLPDPTVWWPAEAQSQRWQTITPVSPEDSHLSAAESFPHHLLSSEKKTRQLRKSVFKKTLEGLWLVSADCILHNFSQRPPEEEKIISWENII